MLAASTTPPPTFDGWLIEPKWDGVRAVVTVHEGNVTIASRLGNAVTGGYPELAALAAQLDGRSAVLDGEIVAFDERTGRPSFQRLQRRMHVRQPSSQLRRDVPVQLLLFDVLWLDGELLTPRPQAERRKVLESLALEGPCWHTSPLLPLAPPDQLLAACREIGMEGYVAKRADAPYAPGRRSPGPSTGDVITSTLYVWSTGDVALGRTAATGTARHVRAPYRFEVLDGVSHWIPDERPDDLNRLRLAHLAGAAA